MCVDTLVLVQLNQQFENACFTSKVNISAETKCTTLKGQPFESLEYFVQFMKSSAELTPQIGSKNINECCVIVW